MPDELVRIDLKGRGLIAFAVDVTATALEAEWRHLAGRVAAEALARLIAGAALAAGFIRDDEQLSVQIKTEGKLRGALVDVDAAGRIRGYTDAKSIPIMDRGPSDIAYAIGARGMLRAIRSTSTEVKYSAAVELVSGDVQTDLERYLELSEQRASVVEIHERYVEKIERAVGVLVQEQPGADHAFFEGVRARRGELAKLLRSERPPEAVLREFFAGEALEVADRRPLRFKCKCSRDKVLGMIEALETTEIAAMVEKDHSTTITCHFCNDQYDVDEATLRGILAKRRAAPS